MATKKLDQVELYRAKINEENERISSAQETLHALEAEFKKALLVAFEAHMKAFAVKYGVRIIPSGNAFVILSRDVGCNAYFDGAVEGGEG